LEIADGKLGGKAMIYSMVANADLRLRAMYEPGEEAGRVTYLG